MSHELPTPESKKSAFNDVGKFADLFEVINAKELGIEYRNAYDEAVEIAKELVSTKDKSSWWDGAVFEKTIMNSYPSLSRDFVAALRRCIANYNPPVNIPKDPLW